MIHGTHGRESSMVAEGKRTTINLLQQRKVIYTLPSGEQIVITPYKQGRGVVEVPEGTDVEVQKLVDREKESRHNM
jgi:hypothetical protein